MKINQGQVGRNDRAYSNSKGPSYVKYFLRILPFIQL